MKNKILLFLVIAIGSNLGLFAQKNSLKIASEASESTFKANAAQYRNSYSYKSNFESFAGFGNSSEIVVNYGKPILKNYQAYHYKDTNGKQEKIIDTSFVEQAHNLGQSNLGAPILTMEEMYALCFKMLSKDTATHVLYFTTDKQGILSTCGYMQKGCMDDCFRGFNIIEFQWLNPIEYETPLPFKTK